jgi:hypothetical protein
VPIAPERKSRLSARTVKRFALAPVPARRRRARTRAQFPAGRHHEDSKKGRRGHRDFGARQFADEVSEPYHLMRPVVGRFDLCQRDLTPALTNVPNNPVPASANSSASR